jgi:hypothetical protein
VFRFVQGFRLHLAYAEPVAYPGGLVLKRIRGSINQTCADTGTLRLLPAVCKFCFTVVLIRAVADV